jgi:release factor glutamine methyltransferase
VKPLPKECSVGALQEWGASILAETSPSAKLDSDLLLGFCACSSRVALIAHPELILSAEIAEKYHDLIKRRLNFEPVAYLIGKKEFFALEFIVNPYVLVPRPETELLVEHALKFVEGSKGAVRVADLGTGSGCIAVSLAIELKRSGRPFEVIAIDSSREALDVARQNASLHAVADRIEFICTDWFAGINSSPFNLIVSNPPYIAEGDPEVSPETRHEPVQALFSGTDGLEAVKILVNSLPEFLAVGGVFLCEIGESQGADVRSICSDILSRSNSDFVVEILPDLSGSDRFLSIRRSS